MSKARRNQSRKRETQEGIAEKGNFVLEILLNDGAPFSENAFKPFINGYTIPFTEKQNAINFLRKSMREGFHCSQISMGIEMSFYPASSIVRASIFNVDTVNAFDEKQKAQIEAESKSVLDEAMEVSDQVARETVVITEEELIAAAQEVEHVLAND